MSLNIDFALYWYLNRPCELFLCLSTFFFSLLSYLNFPALLQSATDLYTYNPSVITTGDFDIYYINESMGMLIIIVYLGCVYVINTDKILYVTHLYT